ncbi:MAG TPA: hypothetical protein VFH27_02575 [Longimicrobiaceae bacterium]|nr:hypothetical protein [Longimicrobiaceae bacterium]
MLLCVLAAIICGIVNPSVGGELLKPAAVVAKSWTRTVVVQERVVTEHSGWEAPPPGALDVRSERRLHHQEEVVDHYVVSTHPEQRTGRTQEGSETRTRRVSEKVKTGTRTYVCGHRDRGNGYFEDVQCTEPVYGTRTRTETYEEPIYRTFTYSTEVKDSTPVYRQVPVYAPFFRYRTVEWREIGPVTAASDTGRPTLAFVPGPDQRLVPAADRRTATFRGAEVEAEPYDLDEDVWRSLRVGQRVAIRIPAFDPRQITVLPADSALACRKWQAGRTGPPPDSMGCSARMAARPKPR